MIAGTVEPGYQRVANVFADNFKLRNEIGAAVCVWVDGQQVVDLWGGQSTADRAWEQDTLSILFSATKGLAAACFLLAEQRGLVDLDQPLASFWPAFSDRPGITIRRVLDHTAGLSGLPADLTLDQLEAWSDGTDPGPVLAVLEAARPRWVPGRGQGYGAISFGLYAAECFHRTVGCTLSAFLRDELAGPLAADVHLGLAAAEQGRACTLYPLPRRAVLTTILPRVLASRSVEARIYRAFLKGDTDSRYAFSRPSALGARGVHHYGTARVRAMALPWASGVATARGLARVYRELSIPDGLFDAASLGRVSRRSTWAWDRVLLKPMGFSQGFVKEVQGLYSPSTATFGHPGAGGTLGFADPENRVAFAYVANRMDFRLRSPRALALALAVYEAMGSR